MKAILSTIWRQDCVLTLLKLAAPNLAGIWCSCETKTTAMLEFKALLHHNFTSSASFGFVLLCFCFVGLFGCFLCCGRCTHPKSSSALFSEPDRYNSMPFSDKEDTEAGLECFTPSCKGWAPQQHTGKTKSCSFMLRLLGSTTELWLFRQRRHLMHSCFQQL